MKVALKITVFHLYDEPPKQFFMITQAQNNSPLEPLKSQNKHKNKTASNIKIEESMKNKGCCTV